MVEVEVEVVVVEEVVVVVMVVVVVVVVGVVVVVIVVRVVVDVLLLLEELRVAHVCGHASATVSCTLHASNVTSLHTIPFRFKINAS